MKCVLEKIMSHVVEFSCTSVANQGKVVVIIDDHPLVSVSLRDLIALHSSSAEVRSFSSFLSSRTVLQNGQPALIILDLNLPDIEGRQAIAAVRAAAPEALLAVLSGNEEAARNIPDTQSKVIRFLHKGLPYHVLSRVVYELLEQCGLANCGHQDVGGKRLMPDRFESLSPKQREVLRLLATGRTNREIAAVQNVSVETIKTHLHDIYVKLQVKSRTQAVLLHQSVGRHARDDSEQDQAIA